MDQAPPMPEKALIAAFAPVSFAYIYIYISVCVYKKDLPYLERMNCVMLCLGLLQRHPAGRVPRAPPAPLSPDLAAHLDINN